MKNFKHFSILIIIFVLGLSNAKAQNQKYDYTASANNPYGKLNPEAPKELADYAPLIGKSECNSFSKQQDGTWADPVKMYWVFKYIMNGTAVQDETLKMDNSHSGSIRQFNADSSKWYVHYFASQAPTARLSAWEGEGGRKMGEEIVLYMPQKAPNGMDGFYKIRFHDISEASFNWVGAWTSVTENFKHETWKIECKKIES